MSLVRVWLAYSPETRPPKPVLEAQIDLSGLFGEFVYIGFSGSNGLGSSLHVVSRWKFKTFQYHALECLPLDSFEEGDCFICSDSAITTTGSNDDVRIDCEKVSLGSRTVRLFSDSTLGIGGLAAFLASAVAIIGAVSCVVIRKRSLAQGTRMESSLAAVDSRLEGRPCQMEEEQMLTVGMACVHPNTFENTMEAARMLLCEVPLPALPAQKPALLPRTITLNEFGSEETTSVDSTSDHFFTPKSNFSKMSV